MTISQLPSIFHSPQGIMIPMYGTPWRGVGSLPVQRSRRGGGCRWGMGMWLWGWGGVVPPSYYKLPPSTPTHPHAHNVDTTKCRTMKNWWNSKLCCWVSTGCHPKKGTFWNRWNPVRGGPSRLAIVSLNQELLVEPTYVQDQIWTFWLRPFMKLRSKS